MILVVTSLVFRNHHKRSLYQQIVSATASSMEKTYIENFDKYSCEFTSNAGWTECVTEKLDRASAEREWKQRRLEAIRAPQVNEYNMAPELSDEVVKIHNWRVNFENGRNSWCEAEMSFDGGSGTPGAIAKCELDFELKAITVLNNLHYNVIIRDNLGLGITNFEPNEADIESLR